jgi:Protein of unknown function (DUF3592)
LNIVYGLVAIGLGLTAFWAARSTHRTRKRVRSWPTVRGQVTMRTAIQPTDRGRTSPPAFRWAPDVRYTYSVDGVDYEGDKTTLPWSATGSRKRAEKVLASIPDETDVRYDPADPKTSCLWAPPRWMVVMWAAAGVFVILLGLVYLA